MLTPEQRLHDLGYSIGEPPAPGAIYKPVVIVGQIAYVSGATPKEQGILVSKGRVPSEISMDQAEEAAALCAANNLRMAKHALGALSRIKRVVRVTGYVNSDPDFTDQHLVINGASRLLKEVFGEAGIGARSAIGVAQLPNGASTEVEMILELHP